MTACQNVLMACIGLFVVVAEFSLNAHSLPCSCPTLAEEKREKKEVTTTYIILVPRGDLGSLQITPDIWSALDPQSMAHHGNPYGNLS